jgi:cell division protease FtsH
LRYTPALTTTQFTIEVDDLGNTGTGGAFRVMHVVAITRVAEEQELSEPSTGAQNDLERATEIARQMVTRFGMSDRMGPLTFGRASALRFLDATTEERNFSERTAQGIDEEVRRIVDEQNARARGIMRRRRAALVALAADLLVKETLEREAIDAIVHDAEEEVDVDDAPSTLRYPRGLRPSPSRA